MRTLLLLLMVSICAAADGKHSKQKQGYIVYMGSPDPSVERESVLQNHNDMLASVLTEDEDGNADARIIHSYGYALSGFAAYMSKQQASKIAEKPGVVSVFAESVLQLHTTRSWDFLDTQAKIAEVAAAAGPTAAAADTIIGMLDTGVWPDSPSFSDAGLGPVPERWRGECAVGAQIQCNRKIVGARHYGTARSARDTQGHGTHTAATAAGAAVDGADVYGLARGRARGGAPGARVAAYRVCSEQGCSSADLLKGMDDALGDGVDVLSLSVGSPSVFQADVLSDPIAIGALHAALRGVLVVCSAGNDGPDASSVVNTAPWITTVAASSIDRAFLSDLVLGNGVTFPGAAINFSNLTRQHMLPLASAASLAKATTSAEDARNCYPGSLDPEKTVGKIVVCANTDDTLSTRLKKATVQSAGGRGMVLLDQIDKIVAFNYGTFPLTSVSHETGMQILSYINSSTAPMATILRTRSVLDQKPAPIVAYFSSRGPGAFTETILKPDISAPGVNILASWVPGNASGEVPAGEAPSYYSLVSGTSMACPHVSGTAALVKSAHPTWTATYLRSAIMTSATWKDNEGEATKDEKGAPATPFDVGAGVLSPARALQPGLVYETTSDEYLLFLCAMSYKSSAIAAVSGRRNFTCPPETAAAGEGAVADLNYPSIALPKLGNGNGGRAVKRRLTNVGPSADAVYEATVESPAGLTLTLTPAKLVFSERAATLSYTAHFAASAPSKGYVFGSITWSDGVHTVRTPFAVNAS